MFKSIAGNVSAEIIQKKSKFICHLYYVESVEEAEELIKQVNKKYFDARHHCYAFSIMTENGLINHFSDDGEPSGTAGAPMLNILTSQNLSNVLSIVTRYFGGVLLGTGGLVKAYSEATMEALNQASIVQKEFGQEVKLVLHYQDLEKMKYYLKQKQINVSHVEYGENVQVIVEITKDNLEKMLEQKENLNFHILSYEMIRKKWIIV